MKTWDGGEQPPNDWDGGDVLYRNGKICPVVTKYDWGRMKFSEPHSVDIIGYTALENADG